MAQQPVLKRTLSLWQLTLYGIGTILGAGIYVLIGEVAAVAGVWAPVSFVLAAVLAGLTGLSFAELSSRYPLSAGEAVYVEQAFNIKSLSMIIGLMVVMTGVVSSATLVNGFAGYFREFMNLPDALLIPVICLVLGAIAAWGIAESVGIAVTITIAEVVGLIIVIAVATPGAIAGTGLGVTPPEVAEAALWFGVLSGAGIAFYAFIGFEDMVNVAEEVKDARRVIPRAIIMAMCVTGALYFVVAVVVVRAMPLDELTSTDAPLAAVFTHATGSSGSVISVIALFAVINGALLQVVMATRVLYGEAAQGWLPGILGAVNPKTRTPLLATAVVTVLVLCFSLWLPLGTLARLTSLIVLVVFAIVNIALIKIKTREDSNQAQAQHYTVALWIPVAGAAASAAFVVLNVIELMR